MTQRMNIPDLMPEAYRQLRELDQAVARSGIEPGIYHLVKLRASQINGCAFCVDKHVKDSLRVGVPERKLHLLAAWRESPLFDARERAALAWTDSLTRVAETGAPDADYAALQAEFGLEGAAQVTMTVALINLLNRMAVGSRLPHP